MSRENRDIITGIDVPLLPEDVERLRQYKKWAMSVFDLESGVTDGELVSALRDPSSSKSRALEIALECREESVSRAETPAPVDIGEFRAEMRSRLRFLRAGSQARREEIEQQYRKKPTDDGLRRAYESVQAAKRNDAVMSQERRPFHTIEAEGPSDGPNPPG
jgi:hypothetical protein